MAAARLCRGLLKNEHEDTLNLLLEKLLKRNQLPINETEALSWASQHLHDAAKHGWALLVELLMKKEIKPDPVDSNGLTPLCVAAKGGHPNAVNVLLKYGADINLCTRHDETPLSIAVQETRTEVVKPSLDWNAKTGLRNVGGRSLRDLAGNSPEILSLLGKTDGVGNLAESHECDARVDREFNATVVDIHHALGIARTSTKRILINEVLNKDVPIDALLTREQSARLPGKPSVRWIHLPANNMRWVEALMIKHYAALAPAYKVLKPENWFRRQHLGSNNAHYARFMRPFCEAIPGVLNSLAYEEVPPGEPLKRDKALGLFTVASKGYNYQLI